jgi:UDP-glucuronate decarboxylase
MRLNDKRLPADLANSIVNNQDIIIYSDGSPTRTFCYVADAIIVFFKALVFNVFEYFNIGIESPEISVKDIAFLYKEIGKKIWNYGGNIIFKPPEDIEYLSHNPLRRCPNIEKARKLLNYNPRISVEEGIKRFLQFFKENGVEGWLK